MKPWSGVLGVLVLVLAGAAWAEDAPAAGAASEQVGAQAAEQIATPAAGPRVAEPAAAPAPAKAPYSLPWQLRPLAPVRAIRLDDSFDLHGGGQTNVLIANVVWAFHPRVYALARFGGTFNAPQTTGASNTLSNVLVGGTYLHPLGDFRIGGFLGVTAPTATGGGNTASATDRTANSTAMLARSVMDNALFAANDLALIPGVGAAWVKGGLTVQAEVTVLELIRVRGEAVQADSAKTNLTSGMHVGYFVTPQFSLGGELRYQRWLTTPVAVAKDEALRHNLNFAVGARVHLKAGPLMLRPGIAYSHGLIGAMATGGHNVLQFDFPVILP